MLIIDSHAHIMECIQGRIGEGHTKSQQYGRIQYSNGKIIRYMPPLSLETNFPPEALIEYMDISGVSKAVLLQNLFCGEMNRYVHHAVKQWPQRFFGAAYLDLWLDDASQKFSYLLDDLGFKIIKIEFSVEIGFSGLYPGARIDDKCLEWFWKESEEQNIIIILDLGAINTVAYQTGGMKNIISRYPGLKIVIAHLCHPPIGKAEDKRMIEQWEQQVLLARHPNVWMDISALPAYVPEKEEYPFPSTKYFIKRAIELVGPDKIMWGSDVPGVLISATYSQLISFIVRQCDYLSEDELAKIMGENAMKVFR